MALNKKQTSMFWKVFAGIVGVALILAFIPWNSFGFSGGSQTDDQDAGALESIAAQYGNTAAFYTEALASDPESVSALVGAGNVYSDWAIDAGQASQGTGAELPMRIAAINYYEQAQAIEPTSTVGVDLAIAYFYTGRTAQAIQTAEAVLAANPEFVPAHFNIAIFYDASGQRELAIAAAQKYQELDPEGQFGDPAIAEQVIAGTLNQGPAE